ncbi:MAG: class I tRNA ligase family protein, partial [Candidatus Desantisbacteria bacterium]
MATGTYKPSEIEPKRIKEWEDKGVYKTSDSPKDKQYVLGMFPYPSGDGLHTGHGRIFTAVDVVARYLRMKGKDVLMPVGWDAFGLPAENAAIKAKTNPMSLVPKNEANFKRQMQMLGLSFDWEKAFSTTDPDYYRWTQWIFLKLYSVKNNKGERLVYRKEVPINWCPKCLTGLANEEVEADGTHERCGTVVTQRMLPQWVMRITDYSDRLLDGLIGLDWPKGILEMQKNWIGRREGTRVKWR